MSLRLRHTIENIRVDFKVFVTLTYPDVYPTTGTEVKRHFKAFIETFRRRNHFKQHTWIWVLEFQERGAPHIHFLSTGYIIKEQVAKYWAGITGGDMRSCSRVEGLKDSECAGLYMTKYLAKQEQKEVPSEFSYVGRMWGVVGEVRAAELQGVPAVNFCSAVEKKRVPSQVLGAMQDRLDLRAVRVVETASGFMAFGPENKLEDLWQEIKKSAGSSVDRKE